MTDLKSEVERLKVELAEWKRLQEGDGICTHQNILRGTIKLTREQALHLACAQDYDDLKAELKEAQAAAAVMRDELERSDDLLGEIHAYGNCDCESPDVTCIPCQCGNKRDGNAKALASSSGKALLERMEEAMAVFEKIRAIATGENQVADTDTEAMGIIQKACDAWLKGGVK